MGDENVPQQPLEAFLSGEFAQLPIIIGTNEDESVAFMFGKMSTAQALAALKMYFGALLLDGHYSITVKPKYLSAVVVPHEYLSGTRYTTWRYGCWTWRPSRDDRW